MMKNWGKLTVIFIMCTLLSACSFFGKKQIDSSIKAEAVQRIETLLVIFDATATLADNAFGQKKLDESKNVLTMLNHELKQLELTSGLRTVANTTQLIHGLSRHDTKKFQMAVNSVTTAKGKISMSAAINAAKYDLKAASGNIAVIIISDGISSNNYALKSAEILASDLGDRLCLYTIRVGNHPQGATYMSQLAQKASCGFPVAASKLNSKSAMKAFVHSIFFGGPKIGLLETDIKGADADGDGVPNSADQCNRTPDGAVVDSNGCWEINKILFDWDKADVQSIYTRKLMTAVKVFETNPYLRVELQGHTDNTGAAEYNQALSEMRAMNVQKILIQGGVSASQLSTKGFGFSRPSAPNDSKENRALNRRVEIVIH
ncbi:MAG: Outer membrane protein, OmpA/MotB [Candidatus Magnetoglobus multicellularis str. Araruama]|uniref:Outer membrane protein, OmpA/MotB n=1 Tax=Candidatus Magnetoglobus multicellularis str. Araruama TaxID=890399 RepID=A0A1V1PC57_9BACT|nr:MAG: Outer membrane protein, OmpA/MotB [Candidatus Magnetoglobus multicellularis str. Araruama]